MVSLPVQWLRAVSDDTALVHDELRIWHERETWVSRNNLSFDLNLLNLLDSVVPANPYNVHTPSCLSESPPPDMWWGLKSWCPLLCLSHTCDPGQTVPPAHCHPCVCGSPKGCWPWRPGRNEVVPHCIPMGIRRDWEDVVLHGSPLSCSTDTSCLGQTDASPYSV